ncbi:MAG: hypothetical protein J0L82_01300 [Deltaproteobacteria bacterium]|nr:hypothetical protein [Deltaproteobacteria bacterium]
MRNVLCPVFLIALTGAISLQTSAEVTGKFSVKEFWETPIGAPTFGATRGGWGKTVSPDVQISRCYDSNCIYSNFASLVSQSAEILKLTEEVNKNLVQNVLRELEDQVGKGPAIGESELQTRLAPLYDTLFSMPWYQYHDQAYSRLRAMLVACNLNFDPITELKAVARQPSQLQRNLLARKCVWDVYGIRAMSSPDKHNRCLSLVEKTLDVIGIATVPGTFAERYTDFLVENPRFDDFIVRFVKKLEPFQTAMREANVESQSQTDRIPKEVQALDLGQLAVEITGNSEDAIRLLQLVVGDPGAEFTGKMLEQRLMRTDAERWARIRPFLLHKNVTGNERWLLSNSTRKFFGFEFRRNWSSRNYKALAGMTLGVELYRNGYSPEEIRWMSRTTGEAYKVQAHIMNAADIKGDKAYFVLDSVAHEVGSDLAVNLLQGTSGEKYMAERYSEVRSESEKRVNEDWSKISVAHSAIQTGSKLKKLFQTK